MADDQNDPKAIRAGEAVDLDAIDLRWGIEYGNLSTVVRLLTNECRRLRAASDAPERDTPQRYQAVYASSGISVGSTPPTDTVRDITMWPAAHGEWVRWRDVASPRASAAPTEEQARRKFMQFHNHYLGWGFDDSGEPHRKENAGVMFTSEGWSRPYERFTLFEKYADHGGDINATECAVIDKAMAAYAALSSPSPAPTKEHAE